MFRKHRFCKTVITLAASLSLLLQAGPGAALDTDIYQANVKQNAYILLDNSGSMGWPVYESSINYGEMYQHLKGKGYTDNSSVFPSALFERTKVYRVLGKDIGLSTITVDGQARAFTGDPGNPGIYWYVNDVTDLHTTLNSAGNLVAEEGQTARLATDANGYVLFDSAQFPAGQNRLLRDVQTLFDGSVIDVGFGGLLKAPGYYYSGYKYGGTDEGKEDLYFFVTGNWLNMQHVLTLEKSGQLAWKTETVPVTTGEWMETDQVLDYPPGSGNYANSLKESDTLRSIVHPGATYIQVHFSMFNVQGDGNTGTFKKDYVKLYNGAGNQAAQYDNDNSPAGEWSPIIPGNTARIALKSNSSIRAAGYTIDKYRVIYAEAGDSYKMETRLEIAKEALLYVVDEMSGKINWGFATFAYTSGGSGNGATIGPYLNPTDNDDTNRAAIRQQVNNVEPKYGTPLGEALQDVFEKGYYGRKNVLSKLDCRRNYVIVVSDGFPSDDFDWSRIDDNPKDNPNGTKSFWDKDGDGFTADPGQYPRWDVPYLPRNYYDDVARWIYTHSWKDKSLVADPANSRENVIAHQIAFGLDHALMQNAAQDGGGQYITAYNKSQLINAFHSLALMISQAISFTAPVVSVDAANKVQNGDDLYMGQFLPMDSTYWPGNLKKFVLGDGSPERPDKWMIYDKDNNEAIDSNGLFLDNTATFWGDDNDPNDSDNYGAPDIKEDGAGEVLTEGVVANFAAGNYYTRTIKTYLSGGMVGFNRTNITPDHLAVADAATRDKVVNWIHGHTFDADATTGNPVAPRDWALGAIVHSRPTVVDYYNTTDFSQVDKRLIVVGANDGMLHVFDDTDGSEVMAFVPPDVLTKLKKYEPGMADSVLNQPLVDGTIKLHRENGHPKYLIFGLRRGGSSYWALDVSDLDAANWTVAWSFSDSDDNEMGESWSDVEIARIRTGNNTFKDVAIFSGGYDPFEDNFPEPFNDLDNNGTPYKANGALDTQEWDKNNASQDVYSDDLYTVQNPYSNSQGRAIYVVDLSNGQPLFTVKYGDANSPALGIASDLTTHTRRDFKYCFPASPSVVSLSQAYSYDEGGTTFSARMSNVLAAIYAPDIYGNLFRITYDYESGKKWQVQHLFSANSGSGSASGTMGGSLSSADAGRKVFYGPAVSWRGSGSFFDSSNYYFNNTTFTGTNAIATLFFGTGDREHPSYKMVQDRVYAVYDDLPVKAKRSSTDIAVGSAPYTEANLLNLTCDELGINTMKTGGSITQTLTKKAGLQTLLTDDVLNNTVAGKLEREPGGGGENDAKGWYIILEKQGLGSYCTDCEYAGAVSSNDGQRDYHAGEKILSKLSLFAGTLYFTSYQPAYDDPCNLQGNAFTYALNYLDGSAALNLNNANDSTGDDPTRKDVTDRYGKHTGVKGLPSGFEIVVRGGQAGAMSSIGGSIIGGGEDGFKIPGEKSGISLYYWVEP
jgi:type IV pilus assembly protein PilY1